MFLDNLRNHVVVVIVKHICWTILADRVEICFATCRYRLDSSRFCDIVGKGADGCWTSIVSLPLRFGSEGLMYLQAPPRTSNGEDGCRDRRSKHSDE